MSKRKEKEAAKLKADAYNKLGVQLEMLGAILDLVHDRLEALELGGDHTCGSAVYAAMTFVEHANELYGQL